MSPKRIWIWMRALPKGVQSAAVFVTSVGVLWHFGDKAFGDSLRTFFSGLRAITTFELALTNIHDQLYMMDQREMANLRTSGTPTFICTPDGKNLFVNFAYADLLHTGPSRLLENGWRSYMTEEDRLVYDPGWKSAFEDERDASLPIRMITADGNAVVATVNVTGIKDPRGKVFQYFGQVVRHHEEPANQ